MLVAAFLLIVYLAIYLITKDDIYFIISHIWLATLAIGLMLKEL